MKHLPKVIIALALALLVPPSIAGAQTPEEFAQFHVELDEDRDGTLARHELQPSLEAQGMSSSEAVLVFLMMDVDESKGLSVEEFQTFPAVVNGDIPPGFIQRLFNYFNTDFDTGLDSSEFTGALVVLESYEDQATTDQIFSATDANRDGRIDYSEFRVWSGDVE